MDDFAGTLGVKPTPAIYLGNGNGTLNAFAAQSGWTNNYVVLSNELFANLRNDNREGTRFILGHETAHIRLHHVALWYNLVLCYSQLVPVLDRRCPACGSIPATGTAPPSNRKASWDGFAYGRQVRG